MPSDDDPPYLTKHASDNERTDIFFTSDWTYSIKQVANDITINPGNIR